MKSYFMIFTIVCNPLAKETQTMDLDILVCYYGVNKQRKGEYNMLTVAYIGFGKSVCEYHLPYVEKRKDFIKVRYIFRREEDRAGDIEREKWYHDIIFTSNINQVMSDQEVDLIIVCAPNEFHVFYTKMALENGKNVLCEKPFAMTSKEAKDVFALAEEKGLLVMANQNRRYDADMRTLRKVLKSGVLGEIVEVESHYDYFRPEQAKNSIGFEKLYGVGVHPIDQMISQFGIPKRVVYDCRSFANPGKSDDYYDIDLFYDRFKVIVKTSYYVKLDYPRFTVHGTRGSFLMPQFGHRSDVSHKPGPVELLEEKYSEEFWGTLSYIDDNGNDITVKIPVENGDYGLIYDNIYDVLKHGAEKAVKNEEVIEVLEILEKGVQIAKEAK